MSTISVTKLASGFILDYGDERIVLDTGLKNEPTLLSHSHFDHMDGVDRASCVFTTSGTLDTISARSSALQNEQVIVKYEQPFSVRNVKVTALDAGHVLGSSMFLMEFADGLTVLYTGDFNVVDSLVHKAAKSVHADVLITEATFGTPEWVFPPRNEVHSDIISKALSVTDEGKIPLFRAYSLGKAQEAISLLQNEGFVVLSGNKAIDAVSDVYSNHGVQLTQTPMSTSNLQELLDDRCVIISSSPKHTRISMQQKLGQTLSREIERRFEVFSLTGWTLGKYGQKGFPLSAHSDFPGLLAFASAVNPRIAYCFTSNAGQFSGTLSGLGINAVPLE
ncbi:MAG: MBL fold metallo-hydrolase [Candidatus Thorarchaeota archaeon]